MKRNLLWKVLLIIGLVIWCVFAIYPPAKKLKPGIDLAGGTSLLYQIDTTGLSKMEKRYIAPQMIRILQKRVDPTNKMNLVFRAHGTDRIEIQMPLAKQETRELRIAYQQKREAMEKKNLNLRRVRQALIQTADQDASAYKEQRAKAFAELAAGQAPREALLTALAESYDQWQETQNRLDRALTELDTLTQEMNKQTLSTTQAEALMRQWSTLEEADRAKKVEELAGADAPKQDLVRKYIQTRLEVSTARNLLSGPEGLKTKYDEAMHAVQKNNIDTERLERIFEDKAGRANELARIKQERPDLGNELDELLRAYDAYTKESGRLDDPEDLKRLVRGSGVLEFRILPTRDSSALSEGEIKRYSELLTEFGPNPKKSGDERYAWFAVKPGSEDKFGNAILSAFAGQWYILASNQPGETMLQDKSSRGWRLQNNYPDRDSYGNPAVFFGLNEVGAGRFLDLTRSNLHKPLCILLDDVAMSAPIIQSPIRERGQITGNFSDLEVQNLVDILNAGSLPARLSDQPISQNSIGPTLGKDNLEAGLKAGYYGLLGVAAFMLIYYMFAGSLADIAMAMNLLITLAVMAFTRATFTMPGIAGLILAIGMAVDANVLIYERIREEQQRGCSLRIAIKNGYDRAFRTILDSNLTTIIPGLLLYLFGSEEVKGFALTLIIGLVSNMFTAVFVTRVIFDLMLGWRILKDKLTMLKVIGVPNINWIGARMFFYTFSILLVAGCWIVFFGRDESKNSKYAIEFTGGTSIQVRLNEKGKDIDRAKLESMVKAVAAPGAPFENKLIANSTLVQQVGEPEKRQYEIITSETNRVQVKLTAAAEANLTAASLQAMVQKKGDEMGDRRLAGSDIQAADGGFVLETNQSNLNRVNELLDMLKTDIPSLQYDTPVTREIVSDAVRFALGEMLDVQNDLQPQITASEPITRELLRQRPELEEFTGGILLHCRFGAGKTETLAELNSRFGNSVYKAEFEAFGRNKFQLFVPADAPAGAAGPLNGIDVAVVSDEVVYRAEADDAWNAFESNEKDRMQAILGWSTSLPQVTQIDPSVGRKSMNDALVAIVLSLLAIIIYIWIRFGNVRFGVAAVVALLHDVSVAIGFVAASAWLADTHIGQSLGISDFKIDLPMIAAFLTLVGFSVNDTIVIFDRIRENRGKMATISAELINRSVNQTLSRTILTTGTVFLVLLVMYIWGGPGLRGFNYVMLIGTISGTYSTLGIASPMLFKAREGKVE